MSFSSLLHLFFPASLSPSLSSSLSSFLFPPSLFFLLSPLPPSLPLLSGAVSQVEALKEENDSLRCQLDAYRNEVELLKQEQGKNQPIRSEEDSTHSQQLSFLQQALQGMQKVAQTPSHVWITTKLSQRKVFYEFCVCTRLSLLGVCSKDIAEMMLAHEASGPLWQQHQG